MKDNCLVKSMGKAWATDILYLIYKYKAITFTKIVKALKINPATANRVLNDFLKKSIIQKQVLSVSPLEVRYCVTPRGKRLQKAIETITTI